MESRGGCCQLVSKSNVSLFFLVLMYVCEIVDFGGDNNFIVKPRVILMIGIAFCFNIDK